MAVGFVTMRDNFMSGWGPATGKNNLWCVECDTQEQEDQIIRSAERRDEMSNIRLLAHPPKNTDTVLVTMKHYNELGSVWHEQ